MRPKTSIGVWSFIIFLGIIGIIGCLSDSESDPNSSSYGLKKGHSQFDILYQFSETDGHHWDLEYRIKMMTPFNGSYQHIETTYIDEGNSIRVMTKYSVWDNSGGRSYGYVTARYSVKGKLIKILTDDHYLSLGSIPGLDGD